MCVPMTKEVQTGNPAVKRYKHFPEHEVAEQEGFLITSSASLLQITHQIELSLIAS